MDFSTIIGLFNIIVGLMLTASILAMGGGLMLWYLRLGPSTRYRDEAITVMQWAVSILFVLVALLYIAQFVQTHRAVTVMVITAALAAAVAYFVATQLLSSGGGEEEHH